jgi:hypothetical protein
VTRIRAIRLKTPSEVAAALDRFAPRYLKDWNEWLAAPPAARPELFGRILRRWQAARPLTMRRIAAEAKHAPPYLDDLFELASSTTGPVSVLGDLTVLDVASRTYQQDKALKALWDLFSGLTGGLGQEEHGGGPIRGGILGLSPLPRGVQSLGFVCGDGRSTRPDLGGRPLGRRAVCQRGCSGGGCKRRCRFGQAW